MAFLDENFLLSNEIARRLYHECAEPQPIVDYHCHLPIKDIAENRRFANLFEIWLEGDHYKWRAMRANGVPEKYVTGDASPSEKFLAWARTVPYTLRNPLYHWTHLELQRYFGIQDILNENSAKKIYEASSEKLGSKDYSVRALVEKMNVRLLCTTDDPLDNLQFHQQIRKEGWKVKVLPAFRPDK